MAKKNKGSTSEEEVVKPKKIVVSFYEDEFPVVQERVENEGVTVEGELNSRNVREMFGLKSTHRSAFKSELRKEIAELSVEQQKEMLETLKKNKA
ncbi:unnamed protein product [marine sediment metagenome]|uniref:Uncharacterized protein n=1 Tax=marine sediment metagenome TaxID=412755 RepID=X1TKU4_9ZZZZ